MKNLARFYGSGEEYDREYLGYDPDIPFLISLCQQYAEKGKVLNLCCGTLREGIPLARAGVELGFTLTGVDITETMLQRGKEKLSQEDETVQGVVSLHLGDMRNIDVGLGEYDLALVPFNSFLHMLTPEDQLAALANISRHLKEGGHLLVDIFLPDVARLAQGLGPKVWREETFVEDREEGELLVVSSTSRYNPTTQIIQIHLYYRVYELESNQLKKGWWSPLKLRAVFPAEWRMLLQLAGYTIVEEWGDYQLSPFDEKAQKMLFLARKS